MPGPTFTRPPATDTGETARRQAFEQLTERRIAALVQPVVASGPVGMDDAPPHPRVEQAQLLRALVDGFVEAVERTNSSRALLRQQPLDYVDAVLLDGSAGQLVADAVEYDAAPVYWQSRAGEVEQLVHGADLDAYLRTGEARYARAIGLR
jgi:hypothetical protein